MRFGDGVGEPLAVLYYFYCLKFSLWIGVMENNQSVSITEFSIGADLWTYLWADLWADLWVHLQAHYCTWTCYIRLALLRAPLLTLA